MANDQGKLDKIEKFLKVGLVATIAIAAIWFGVRHLMKARKGGDPTRAADLNCVTETKEIPVVDTFMEPIFRHRSMAKLQVGFYACNKMMAGDVVAFMISPQIPIAIRKLEGLPGDTFDVSPVAGKKDAWNVWINGKMIERNGQKYEFTFNTVPPLKTYALSRSKILAADEVLVFTEANNGITDSGNLGMLKVVDLLGRVVP